MLPKVKTNRRGDVVESVDSYSRRLARSQVPSNKPIVRKVPKSGLWRGDAQTKTKGSQGVSFNLKGDCEGPLDQVTELGVRLAKEAIARGETALGEQIIKRLETLALEYRLKAEIAKLEKAG